VADGGLAVAGSADGGSADGGSADGGPATFTSVTYPYLARAWWGEQLLAESNETVLFEQPGQLPELYFPLGEVSIEALTAEEEDLVCPVRGRARQWGMTGDPAGGRAVWNFDRPAPGLEWLKDLVAFDHDRVRVEVIDHVPGERPQEASTKRFPVWGEAEDLVEVLDVKPAGESTYTSVARSSPRRPVVEGSQMLGQAMVAVSRHAPGRRVVSGHMVFTRVADASAPLHFDLEAVSSGRTFSCLSVKVSQAGRSCARGMLLLDVTAPDVIRHSAPAPEVAGPYDSVPCDMSVTGRDIRVVGGTYDDAPDAPAGPPVIDTWVRFRQIPDDQCIHDALLAQFTGHMSIAAALRPHEGFSQRQAHRTLSTAINAISISLHDRVRADQWMLYHHQSTFAGDGMTHSESRVYDEEGRLLASFAVDAMVRAMVPGPATTDDRTAL
jgi:acyl-CoA thioesterase/uncharacterized protein (DUF427 family)